MTVTAAAEPTAERPRLWPISVEAYHRLGEAGLIPKRTELLYGQVFQKMSKSPIHSGLVLRLLRWFQAAVPPGWHVRPEQPLTCADSEPEPDLAVVQGREEEFWQAHPQTAALVVEVCVNTHEHDCSKLRAYAAAGVNEVWFVLGPEQQVEVHRRLREGSYAERIRRGPGDVLISEAVPTIQVDLNALFGK
ncbi:MAG: Uma2 family endonuclease [Verrucomicrobia bacterium]|nr:Uma2 family endonuclease [Verrucomicrobiota bacterium]